MEVKIKDQDRLVDATIEMVDGVMVVSPKEVKFEPKDGDVVACDPYGCIELFIFKEWKYGSACECHCYYNEENDTLYIDGDDYIVTRYATEEEKKNSLTSYRKKVTNGKQTLRNLSRLSGSRR